MRFLYLIFLFPALASAGEDCSMLGGICREVCGVHEEAEKGAFLDCTDKQECCVKKEADGSADRKSHPDGKVNEQKSRTEK